MSFCPERELDENKAEDKNELYRLWLMKRTEMLMMQYRGININNYHICLKLLKDKINSMA